MIIILKIVLLALALLILGICAISAYIAHTVRDYFACLLAGGFAVGTLALVIHYIF